VNRAVGKLGAGNWAAPASPAGLARSRPQHLWTGDFRSLRLRLYLLMFAADCAALAAAFLLANLIRYGHPFESYGLNTFALLLPIYLATSLNGGAYSIRSLIDPRQSAAMAVQALVFSIAVATALLFSLKMGEDFSRLVFGIGSIAAIALVALGRVKLGNAVGKRCGWTFRREVLLADGIAAAPSGTERLVDAAKEGLRPVLNDPDMLQRLAALLGDCERVVIACPPERRSDWSRVLAGANVDVEILVPELDHVGAIGLHRHGDSATLLVGCGPLGLRQRAFKRLFDVAVSGSALVLLSPLLLAIALIVRLESPGQALFRQQRVGRGNRLFSVLKFRTMRADRADANGGRSASREDDRTTAFGRFLRRTSLDELPQLLNVLAGQMSIVGPRPHALGSTAEDDVFWTIEERYWDRHAIKPGMTGLAQVRGLRGATVRRSDLSERLKADLEYLDGWTLGRDVGILFRTVGVMAHRNAY
jgi:exopolysaccharide biosynthesis polyprenyl glycosylphosphotransferase